MYGIHEKQFFYKTVFQFWEKYGIMKMLEEFLQDFQKEILGK